MRIVHQLCAIQICRGIERQDELCCDADAGQTWPGAAASSFGMWVVMMVAMMLPTLVPVLWRYRQAVGRTGETRLVG